MDRDYGAKQEKMEALARNMAFIVKNKYPGLASDVSVEKRGGLVKIAYQSFVRIIPMPGDASYFEMVPATVAKHGIDMESIKEAWNQRSTTDSAVYERG